MQDERPILLIEDELDSVMTFRRVLNASACYAPLVHAQDKEGALLFLQEPTARPRLVVMNMDAPSISGLAFLDVVKQDPLLLSVPVVGLATDRDPTVIQRSFELGIAGYIIKAEPGTDYATQIAVILNYWQLSRVALATLLDECLPKSPIYY